MMDIYNYLTASADGCICSCHSVRIFHVPLVRYNSIHSISKLYVQPTSYHVYIYICMQCLLARMETYDDNVNTWAGAETAAKKYGGSYGGSRGGGGGRESGRGGEVEGRGGRVCMTGLSPLL